MTHEQSAKSNGVCLATVTNTVKKYFEGGIDAVTEFKRNVNSDNARRVLDGRAEARIIELACDPMPEGHSRWTIRLLEEKSKIVLGSPLSREAIRRQGKRLSVVPPARSSMFFQSLNQNTKKLWVALRHHFNNSFRPQCNFFICFHNDTVSFLCYEKSVSEKYGR